MTVCNPFQDKQTQTFQKNLAQRYFDCSEGNMILFKTDTGEWCRELKIVDIKMYKYFYVNGLIFLKCVYMFAQLRVVNITLRLIGAEHDGKESQTTKLRESASNYMIFFTELCMRDDSHPGIFFKVLSIFVSIFVTYVLIM